MRNNLIIVCLLALSACQDNSTSRVDSQPLTENQVNRQPSKPHTGTQHMTTTKTIHGTIQYMQFEGGFYGIVTDRGLNILPVNLKRRYLQDGAKVEFSGEFVKGMATIQQWGRPFRIDKIEILKPGKTVDKSIY